MSFASAQASDEFSGQKINDINADGVFDGGEPGLNGWSIWTSILVDDFSGATGLGAWTYTAPVGTTGWHEGVGTACDTASSTTPIEPYNNAVNDGADNGYAYFGDSADCDYDEGTSVGGTMTFGNPSASAAVTLPASGDMFLHFNYRLGTENSPSNLFDDASVEVATAAGGPWLTLASNTAGIGEYDLAETGDSTAGSWSFATLDLSTVTPDLHGEDLYLRFRFSSIDAVDNAHLGWQIDDIYVTVANDVTATGTVVGQYNLTGLSGSASADGMSTDTVPSSFLLCETQQGGYGATAPTDTLPNIPTKPDTYSCYWEDTSIDGTAGAPVNRTFLNAAPGNVTGYKFDDTNGNGTWESGEPTLANWTIDIYLDDGDASFEPGGDDALVNSTTTDGSGYYTFESLTAGGDFWVSETVQSGWTNTTAADVLVTIGSDQTDNVTFGNFADATVNGYKIDDLDGDGNIDVGEPGLAGWTIFIDSNGNGTLDGGELSDVTNATGYYEITGIGPGLLDIYGQVPLMEVGQSDWCNTHVGGHNWLTEVDACLNFNAIVYPMLTSGSTATVDWANFELFNATVFKFEDLNGNGTWESGEPGLSGWDFNLTSALTNSSSLGTTDANGYVNFTDLGPGGYDLNETGQTGWTNTLGECDTFNATSGGDLLCEWGNFQNVTFNGTKYEDLNGNGTFDAGEPGLAGWTFFTDTNGNGTLDAGEAYGVTNATGYYEFEADLTQFTVNPDGTLSYQLFEELPDDWCQTYVDAIDLLTLLGECSEDPTGAFISAPGAQSGATVTHDFGNFELYNVTVFKFEDLNGNGTFDAGEPGIEGWNITLTNEYDGATSMLTDANGYANFTDVGPGWTNVSEELPDGWLVMTGATYENLTVSSGTNQSIEFGNFELNLITGFKLDDVTGNGTDDGDAGLADWLIFLDQNDNGDFDDEGDGDCDGDLSDEPCVLTADGVTDDLDDNGSVDPIGFYAFTDLFLGDYTVCEVVQSDWVQTSPGTVSGMPPVASPDCHPVSVTQSGEVHERNFTNFQLFDISGLKFEDLNADGDQDPNEFGIAGWEITIEELVSGDTNSTTTDGDGLYSFTDLGPGTYRVREVAQEGWSQSTDDPDDIVGMSGVDANETNTPGLAFGNSEVISVSGKKFNDLDGDGIFDAGEPGIEGWTIFLDLDNDLVDDRNMTTDEFGDYAFIDVPAGQHRVHEQQNASWVQTRPADTNGWEFNVFSGVSVPDLDFGNFELTTISGYKWEDANGNGEADEGDVGLQNVTVYVDADDSGDFTDPSDDGCTGEADEDPCAVTGSDGNYTVSGVGPGPHDLLEVVPDGYTQTCGPANPLSPTSGEDMTGQDFCNWMGGSISGQKFTDLYGDGNLTGDPPIEGWAIALFLDDGAFPGTLDEFDTFVTSTTTNETGAYSFGNLPDGDYIVAEYGVEGWIQTVPGSTSGPVQFNADEPQGGTYDVTIAGGSDATGLDFGNYAPASIQGRKFLDSNENGVFDSGEVGLNGWTINAFSPEEALDSDVTHRVNNLTTGIGEDGHFSLVVPPGDYEVCEDLQTGWTNTTPECVLVSLGNGDAAGPILFGNVPSEISISGVKYEDANGNGTREEGEDGLADWTIVATRVLANFDDVEGDVEMTGLWHVTSGCGGSFYGQDNMAYFGMDATCDFDDGFTSGLLSLPAIVVPSDGTTSLNFVYRLETERSDDADRASIEVSSNGGLSWVTVASNYGVGADLPETMPSPPEATNGFVPYALDLGDFAGDSILLRLRFTSVDGEANGFLGWQVDDLTFRSVQVTDEDGDYSFDPLSPGTYVVSEDLQDDWVQTEPGYSTDGSAVYLLEVDGEETDVDFGNFQLYDIVGVKFEDHDGDGERDCDGEDCEDQGLEDWEITLAVGAPSNETDDDTTDGDGEYGFFDVGPGQVLLCETLQEGWVNTLPSGDPPCHQFTGQSGEDQFLDFGNFEVFDLEGIKFNDLNANGTRDEGEPGLEGWNFTMTLGSINPVDIDEVPDMSSGDLTPISTIIVTSPVAISELAVILHTSTGCDDHSYYVTSPMGTTVQLNVGSTDCGLVFSGGTTYFDGASGPDSAPDHPPEATPFSPLAAFIGEDPSGVWTLSVVDEFTCACSDTTLNAWFLLIHPTFTTETDGDGEFGYSGLGPGSYVVCELLEDGWMNTTDRCQGFLASSGEDVGPIEFGNWEPASITVFKYEDVDHSGDYSEGDEPIVDWEFELFLEGDFVANGTTNATGFLVFDDLMAGDYNVTDILPPYWVNTDPGTGFQVVLLDSGDDEEIEFGNFELASIHGHKIRDDNGNGTHDEGESGINDWTIFLLRELADFSVSGDGSGPSLDEFTATGLWHATDDGDCDDGDEAVGDHSHPEYAAYNTDGDYVSGDGRPLAADPGSCTYDTVDGSDVPTANSGALTTTFLPIPADQGFLGFVYRLDIENTNPDKDKVDVAVTTNGLDYTVLASNYGLGTDIPQEDSWTPYVLDLSDYAGQDVQLRFRFDSVDSVDNGFFGWQLDDIRILQAVTLTEDCGYGEAMGCYWFFGLEPGVYIVMEEQVEGWTQTCPEGGVHRIVVPDESGFESEDNDFCNQPPEGPVEPNTISGYKFHDANGNLVWDEGEDPIAGYPIELYLGLSDAGATTTDSDGYYEFTNLTSGTYTVVEGDPSVDGGNQTYPDGESSDVGPVAGDCSDASPVTTESLGDEPADVFGPFGWEVVLESGCVFELNFGNQFPEEPVPEGTISGVKFNDINGDGEQGEGEPGIENWVVYADLNGNGVLDAFEPVDVTDEDGAYTLTGLSDGTYTVREVLQPGGWVQTYPSGGSHTVVITGESGVTGRDFGNQLPGEPQGCGTIANPDCVPGSGGGNASDTSTVPPDPSAPIVNAGPDITSTGSSGFQTGTASDPQSGIVSSLWELISGPDGATIDSPVNDLTTGFMVDGLPPGDYVFRLTATNAFGTSASDTFVFHHVEESSGDPEGCGTIANPDCVPS